MTAPLSEVTVKWNGTACAETVGDVDRSILLFPEFNEGDTIRPEAVLFNGIRVKLGDIQAQPGTGLMLILGEYGGSSSDQAVIDRVLLDDWGLMQQRYNPFDDLVELEISRKNAVPATVTRHANVHALRPKSLRPAFTPQYGERDDGYRTTFYLYPVYFRNPDGVWIEGGTPPSDTASIGASPDTFTLGGSTDQIKEVGCRLTFSSVSGTITVVTLTIGATTYATLTHASAFANGDYIDFGYTTRGQLVISDPSNISINPLDWVPATAAGATYTATRTTGTGTATLTGVWLPEFGSW